MASVNLWELITTVASKSRDLPNMDKCQAIQAVHGPRFGTELSLEICNNGTWVVTIFDHEDSAECVILAVHANGHVQVERKRSLAADLYESRCLSF